MGRKQRYNILRGGYRYSVFTSLEELRNLLKEFQDEVYKVINYWYKKERFKF